MMKSHAMKIRISRGTGEAKKNAPRKVAIPDSVQDIVKRLSKKYELDFEAVTVRGREFYFLHLADIEPLVAGKDIFANASEFPFWVKIWEASMVMANLMAAMPVKQDRRILELGSGLAAAGIVGAAFGHDVTITDYEQEIMDFVHVSAAVNGCEAQAHTATLDWLNPSDLGGKFDVIIGSEVLFHERFFQPLLDCFEKYLKPDGVIYMAHDRRRKSLAPFLRMCEDRYQIAAQQQVMKSKGETLKVVLTRLLPK